LRKRRADCPLCSQAGLRLCHFSNDVRLETIILCQPEDEIDLMRFATSSSRHHMQAPSRRSTMRTFSQ